MSSKGHFLIRQCSVKNEIVHKTVAVHHWKNSEAECMQNTEKIKMLEKDDMALKAPSSPGTV